MGVRTKHKQSVWEEWDVAWGSQRRWCSYHIRKRKNKRGKAGRNETLTQDAESRATRMITSGKRKNCKDILGR